MPEKEESMARRNPFSKKAGGGLRMQRPFGSSPAVRKGSGKIVKNPLCGVSLFGGQRPLNEPAVAPQRQPSGGMFGFGGGSRWI